MEELRERYEIIEEAANDIAELRIFIEPASHRAAKAAGSHD